MVWVICVVWLDIVWVIVRSVDVCNFWGHYLPLGAWACHLPSKNKLAASRLIYSNRAVSIFYNVDASQYPALKVYSNMYSHLSVIYNLNYTFFSKNL